MAKAAKKNKNEWVWLSLSIIFIVTFVIYFKAIKFDFLLTWDDPVYISENVHITDFHWQNLKLFFTKFYVNNYQPLTMLLYAFEYKIGHGNASLFHFNNILFHLLNTYLVFILIRKISPDNVIVALITAAFFAVHPMHVESVAWVAERKDVLYSFFFLIALITYTNYLKSGRLKALVLTGVFFMLSCLSKLAAVILPLIMLLLDYYLNRKYTWKIIIEKIPFFIVSIVFGIIAIYSQKSAIENLAPDLSITEQVFIISHSLITYLLKAIIPVSLSAIYPYPVEIGTTLPIMYYLSVLFVAGLLVFIWYSRRWGKDIIFGFLFFIITLILVLQFIPVGAAAMADRYTYIPYIGIFFIIGKFIEHYSTASGTVKKKENYILIAVISYFICFSLSSYGRVQFWNTDEALFSDAKHKYPYCPIPFFVIGDYYVKQYTSIPRSNKELCLKKAFAEYHQALNLSLIETDKVKAYYNIGLVKCYSGEFTSAISDYDKAIQMDPGHIQAYINRGNTKHELHDYKGALADLNKAISLDPRNTLAINNRGIAKYDSKDYQGAIEDYDTALKIDSNYAKCYNDRGSAKFMLKDYQGALNDYKKAVKIDPGYTDAINNRNMVEAGLNSIKK